VRTSFVVYGLLYILLELIGERLEEIGWPRLTALDVATAVAHGILTVAIGVAVLVAVDVLGRRWHRSMAAWRQERARLTADAQPEAVTVRSWRPERPALPPPAPPAPLTGPDYAATTTADASLPLYVPSEIIDRDGRRL
jgi:hypothetical protein